MATKPVENWSVLRLVIRIVSLGDACGNSSIRGTWRLAPRVPRQAVWKPFASGDSCGAPGDFWWSRHRVLLTLDVHGLLGFGRYLKRQMLEYSWSCGLGWRVIRAFFELWPGIASVPACVPACVLRVVACRLAATISWVSIKDVKHGLHVGIHVRWDQRMKFLGLCVFCYRNWCICFILLAHPICLCLAMIVYVVHGSNRCCRWIW